MHMLISRILYEPEQVNATALFMPSITYGLSLHPDRFLRQKSCEQVYTPAISLLFAGATENLIMIVL
jgi:hypothetical protein